MTIDNQYNYWNSVAENKNFTHPVDVVLLLKYIGREASVLDFGCGYGRLPGFLNENGFHNIIGYDTSSKLVERGRKHGLNLFYLEKPGDLPEKDNSVDCILLFAVLTCIPSNKAQQELIALLHAKLKEGGIIYISDYYLQENSTEMDRYAFLNGDKNNAGVFTLPEGVTFRHHTQAWIRNLLSGFHIIEEVNVDVKTMNGHQAKAFQMILQKK